MIADSYESVAALLSLVEPCSVLFFKLKASKFHSCSDLCVLESVIELSHQICGYNTKLKTLSAALLHLYVTFTNYSYSYIDEVLFDTKTYEGLETVQ